MSPKPRPPQTPKQVKALQSGTKKLEAKGVDTSKLPGAAAQQGRVSSA